MPKAPHSLYQLCAGYLARNLYSVLNVKNKALRAIAQGVSDALYKKADRLIAMSEPLQQRLCQRTGMSPQKLL